MTERAIAVALAAPQQQHCFKHMQWSKCGSTAAPRSSTPTLMSMMGSSWPAACVSSLMAAAAAAMAVSYLAAQPAAGEAGSTASASCQPRQAAACSCCTIVQRGPRQQRQAVHAAWPGWQLHASPLEAQSINSSPVPIALPGAADPCTLHHPQQGMQHTAQLIQLQPFSPPLHHHSTHTTGPLHRHPPVVVVFHLQPNLSHSLASSGNTLPDREAL
jgi:hypothetical protein